jgi:hypothetical protein
MAKKNLPVKTQIRAIIKFHELFLTFDSSLPNEQIEKQCLDLIESINALLKTHFPDTLPQLSNDTKKKNKISVLPFNPDDFSDE